MKKTVSMLLVFVILLSLCACGKKPASNTTDPDQETSTGIEETSNSTTETPQATDMEETTVSTEDTTTTPSEENNTKPTEKPIEPTGATEKPVEPTNPTEAAEPEHTHSYSAATCTQAMICSCGATSGSALGHSFSNATCTEAQRCSHCGTTEGSALGHKWIDATCTMPKTCSVCKVTEGNAVGHSWNDASCSTPKTCAKCNATEGSAAEHILDGTVCKWCKNVIAVDPSNFNASVSYSCISKHYDGEVFSYPSNFDCYVFTLLDFDGEAHSEAVHDAAQCPYRKDGHRHVHHNGNYYDNISQSFGLYGETTYKIVNSEIVVTAPVLNKEQGSNAGPATIHFQLLSNGTLKILALSGTAIPEIAGIEVGTVFYPNPNPEIRYY